jgi:hypothetical protein
MNTIDTFPVWLEWVVSKDRTNSPKANHVGWQYSVQTWCENRMLLLCAVQTAYKSGQIVR